MYETTIFYDYVYVTWFTKNSPFLQIIQWQMKRKRLGIALIHKYMYVHPVIIDTYMYVLRWE